jgi:Domain of unknown function (DUF4440)
MLIALALAAAAPAIALPEGAALREAIVARDSEFFALFFEGCDAAKVRTMLSGDFEMYHDKGGMVARGADPFIADYAKSCEERKKPDAWRSRRELLPETLSVHPVPGYGAIEDGEHVFYERRGNGPEKKAGRARFTQVWQLTPGGWRLSRVLSYAHRPAE